MQGAIRVAKSRSRAYSSLTLNVNAMRPFSKCALNPTFARETARRRLRPNSTVFSRSMAKLDLDPELVLSLLLSSLRNDFAEAPSDQRLNETTAEKLREFCQNLDPASATDDDLTFLLQHLKASDVPSMAVPGCIPAMSLSHALMAFQSIGKILASSQDNPRESHTVQRIVHAWPEIKSWMLVLMQGVYYFGTSISSVTDMMDGHKGVIPFLSAAATTPTLRDLVFTEPAREQTLNDLILCWMIETSESFISQAGYDPSRSAAFPLATLITNDSRPKHTAALDFFRVLLGFRTMLGAAYNPSNVAKTALAHLRTNSPSLDVSNAHMQMVNLLGIAVPYSDALLAQHSIRDVTRFLSDLTSKPYDSASAPKVLQCIESCMAYLTKFMPTKDGFSNVRMALQAGLLPAILRCSDLVSEGTALHDELLKSLHTISLYIIYPSVLRSFLASSRKTDTATMDKTKPLRASYTNLVQFVYDRITMLHQRCDPGSMFNLCVQCNNCGKADIDASFKGCSGCFDVYYCSESCQKEDWKSHEPDCELIQVTRKDGQPLLMSPTDADGIAQVAMLQVYVHRAEIVRVWKEEGPTRTPFVAFDFTEDPAGVMVVGKRCLETPPGKTAATGIYVPELKTVVEAQPYFRSLWLETSSRKIHEEDAILCTFLPQGDTPKGKWSRFCNEEEHKGTAFEGLLKWVEDGVKIGRVGPPVC